jgi:hypothetical protein
MATKTATPELNVHRGGPDEGLPIAKYRFLSIREIVRACRDITREQVLEIREYETKHQNRRTLLVHLDRILNPGKRGRSKY